MKKTAKKYMGKWLIKLMFLFILVFIAVLLVSYSSVSVMTSVDSNASKTAYDAALLDPFTLTVSPLLESRPILIESDIILTERRLIRVRAPYRPPWPPPQKCGRNNRQKNTG